MGCFFFRGKLWSIAGRLLNGRLEADWSIQVIARAENGCSGVNIVEPLSLVVKGSVFEIRKKDSKKSVSRMSFS